jgi:GxxExxY protein
MTRIELTELTEKVIGAAFEVANTLGPGFLEKVYERALVRELALRGVRAEQQVGLKVMYKGEPVGEYLADILVEGEVMVEMKCVEQLRNEHMAQCLNYLKASGRRICLLLNFQRARVECKRVIYGSDENDWPQMDADGQTSYPCHFDRVCDIRVEPKPLCVLPSSLRNGC